MTQNFGNDGAPFSVAKLRALASAHESEGVLSGCGLSTGTNSFEVDIASGSVDVQQSNVSVSAQTVTHSSSGTEDRIDLITVNSSGTASVTEGSQASTSGQPNAPDIPSGEVLLGIVHVRGGSSEILSGDIHEDYRTPVINAGIALANLANSDQFSGYPLDTDTDTDHAASDHHDGGTLEIDAGNLDASSASVGQVLGEDGSGAAAWIDVPHPLYGDGADGNITRSSNANENGGIRAETYSIDSGVTMTVSDGAVLIAARDSITISGTLDASGQGGSGGAGSTDTSAGANGTNGTYSPLGAGGGGGNSATASSGDGGDGGDGDQRTFPVRDGARTYGVAAMEAVLKQSPITAGAGGGGGGGGNAGGSSNADGSNGGSPGGGGGGGESTDSGTNGGGGDGGDGGGVIILLAPTVTLESTGTIDVSGTAGQDGSASLGGGGGGGSGGAFLVVSENWTNNGTINFGGGAGGTGASLSGNSGGDGAAGDGGDKINIEPL